mgnify:CR=1 FL=1
MALSYVSYVGNGSTTEFSFGAIDLLQSGLVPFEAQLVVSVDGTIVPASTYVVSNGTKTLDFVTAPVNGAAIRIQRVTKSDDRYVDWTNATNLNQEQLNLDSDQLLFLNQEASDAAQETIRLGLDGDWNAESKTLGGVADGVDNLDAVNVQQLNAALFGGTPGTVSGQVYVSSDDGSTTFVLPSLAGSDSNDINLFRDGTRLTPNVDYGVTDNLDGSSLNVSLLIVPGSDLIEIVYTTGILAASLASDSVDNDNVKDGVLTPAKLANPGTDTVLLNVPGTGPEWGTLDAVDIDPALTVALPGHSLSELAVPTGDLSVGSVKVTNLADPVATTDAVNLQTLQNQITALQSQITAAADWGVGTLCGIATRTDGSPYLGTNDRNRYMLGGYLSDKDSQYNQYNPEFYYAGSARGKIGTFDTSLMDPSLIAAAVASSDSLTRVVPSTYKDWDTAYSIKQSVIENGTFGEDHALTSTGGKIWIFQKTEQTAGIIVDLDSGLDPTVFNYPIYNIFRVK